MSRSSNFVVRVASRSLQLGRRRPATTTASSVLLYRLIFTSGVATRAPHYPYLSTSTPYIIIPHPLYDLCVRMDYLTVLEEVISWHS